MDDINLTGSSQPCTAEKIIAISFQYLLARRPSLDLFLILIYAAPFTVGFQKKNTSPQTLFIFVYGFPLP